MQPMTDAREPPLSDVTAFSEVNRRNWDERVPVHRADRTGFYAVEKFRRGGDVLGPIESGEIGDVSGKQLLHLQCHFGLDTLSLARRGAGVTGLDFSAPAIETARELAADAGLAARFVHSDVYDAHAALAEAFDVVYSSWGAICWLHDIRAWTAIVARFLSPGGFLYMAEAHPAAMPLEQEGERLYWRDPWRSAPDEPIGYDVATTYTGDDAVFANTRGYNWNHALSDILCGLIDHGLRIDFLHEHETVPWYMFPKMTAVGDGMYRLPDGYPRIPLSFSLKASKPAG
jgi:2-polyprenyl-3-methyl-5-hydroxy-6-metoxy-1,4-benzoquinol methylase